MDISEISMDEVATYKPNPRSEKTIEIIGQLHNLPPGRALKITLEDRKQANIIYVRLYYYKNKRHRGLGTFPNLCIVQRKNLIICWLDNDKGEG